MKNHVNSITKALCLMILVNIYCSSTIKSQTPSSASTFNLVISNERISDGKILEFDLYLISMDKTEPFELASIQAGIKINPEIYNGGTIIASLVEGSSQLLELQQPVSVMFVQNSDILKLAGRIIRPVTKEPLPSSRGSIISTSDPGTRICRIRLTSTADFAKASLNLAFCFDRNPYPTSVSKYISGINTPLLCDSKNCFSKTTNDPLK